MTGTLLFVAVAAVADISPGPIVSDGKAMAVVADVNGDGLTDVVLDREALVNQGGGAFLKRSLGLRTSDVAVDWLDANGDGRADLLARDTKSNGPGAPPAKQTYRVYLAGANGKYDAGTVIPNDERVPYIAEVNGDGREDIVLIRQLFSGTTNIGTELKVLLSKGDGTFTARDAFRFGPRDPQLGAFNRLLSGDLNGDGHRDLVFRTPWDLIVVRGTGDGNFAGADIRFLPMQPFGFWFTELADVDRDGNLDVLLAGQRTVRVFYGDGRGNFPRMTATYIRRTHETVIPPQYALPHPPHLPPMTPDNLLQPRNFAVGRFVREGRFELAVGTGEGDVVIYAYEQGTLREVSRLRTELLVVDVHAGAFFAKGRTDLYITWNFGYLEGRPRPRLIHAEPEPAAAQPDMQRRDLRTRAIRGAGGPVMTFEVVATGECVTAHETWSLTREGIFGRQKIAGRNVETTLENGILAFRLETSWTRSTAIGELTARGRRYEGTVEIETPCGWKPVTLVATPR